MPSKHRKVAICLDPDCIKNQQVLVLVLCRGRGDPPFLNKKTSTVLVLQSILEKEPKFFILLDISKGFSSSIIIACLMKSEHCLDMIYLRSRTTHYICTMLMVSEMACPANLIMQRVRG